jgi:hypothetical protein
LLFGSAGQGKSEGQDGKGDLDSSRVRLAHLYPVLDWLLPWRRIACLDVRNFAATTPTLFEEPYTSDLDVARVFDKDLKKIL